MLAAGIDIGSRTVKAVVVEDSNIVFSRIVGNTFDPIGACREVLDGVSYDVITATGYGRHLFAQYFPRSVITEIHAVTMGARQLLPGAQTILEIGGQDTKVVEIDGGGLVGKFERRTTHARQRTHSASADGHCHGPGREDRDVCGEYFLSASVPSRPAWETCSCPAWVSTPASPLADGISPPSALARAFPDSLPSGARTSRPSGDPPLLPLRSPSLSQRLPAGSTVRTPCPSSCTTRDRRLNVETPGAGYDLCRMLVLVVVSVIVIGFC